MRSLLDHQADGIEYTLHSHAIEASVVGGNISPRLIQFHIKLEAGVKYSRVTALAEELAIALNVNHCRITREGHLIKIEVPRPDPVAVRLFPLMRNLPGELPENAPILGLDENGVPLLLRLGSPDIAHVLIAGASGSGKTVLARSMIASLALQNPPERLRILLIDPKGRGYRHFNGLPNLVCPIVTDSLDAVHRLKWAVRHMEKREEQGTDTPALAIFIDEISDLTAVNAREVEAAITRLIQGGRDAGIHLVVCAQKLSPGLIGVARNYWPTRIVGRSVSIEEAKLASNIASSGAEKLMGQGDFLLFAKGEASRLQAAHISPAEMEQTVVHLGGVPGEIEAPRAASTNRARPQPRPQAQARYSAPVDDYAEEEEYEEQPKPRRAASASRNFRQSTSVSYQEQDPQSVGVSERLSRYQESIQERRRQRGPEEEQDETEYPYYNPARAQQRQTENTRPTPRPRPEYDEEEFEQRPTPTQRPPKANSRSSEGSDEARNIMNSSTKSNLFKMTKISS